MTDVERAERELRTLLTDRAAGVPPKDLHDAVVRRARRHRVTVLAATATAVALVAAGVPAALAVVRDEAAPPVDPASLPVPDPQDCGRRPGDPVAPPAAVPGLPAQQDVRGSLGGDPAAVVAVARAGWGPLSLQANGAFDPRLTRVQVAHRAEDGWIVGLVSGRDRAGRLLAQSPVVGPDLQHLTGFSEGWTEGTGLESRRFTGGASYATFVTCGKSRVIAVVPDGATVEAVWTADIAADGTVVQESQPLPRRPDGLVVGTLTSRPVDTVSLRVTGGDGAARATLYGSAAPRVPTRSELAPKLLAAPGNLADRKNKVGYVNQEYRIYLPVRQRDVRVLWAGQGEAHAQAAVATSTLPSGAHLLWGAAVGERNGRVVDQSFVAAVAAGALDRTAFRVQTTADFVPGERPQGIFFTGTRQVEVTSGGRTDTRSVTGGLFVDRSATVVVRGPGGAPLPLVDVRTGLQQVPQPRF